MLDPKSPWSFERAAGVVLIALALAACSGDATATGESCGDGLCSRSEDESSCPRDCPSLCARGTTRCAGNVLLVCTDDGLNELAEPCDDGQVCTASGCRRVEVPDAGLDADPDVGLDVTGDALGADASDVEASDVEASDGGSEVEADGTDASGGG